MQACRKGERFGQVSVLSPPGQDPAIRYRTRWGPPHSDGLGEGPKQGRASGAVGSSQPKRLGREAG